MADLHVNTERILGVAEKVGQINNQIRDEFSDVEKAMALLDQKWDSPSSSNVMDKFTSIRNHFCANRHEVLGNYVRFLQNQVNVGYIATEETNTELAGQFK